VLKQCINRPLTSTKLKNNSYHLPKMQFAENLNYRWSGYSSRYSEAKELSVFIRLLLLHCRPGTKRKSPCITTCSICFTSTPFVPSRLRGNLRIRICNFKFFIFNSLHPLSPPPHRPKTTPCRIPNTAGTSPLVSKKHKTYFSPALLSHFLL
jgi:hypothetical protein